MLPIHFGERFIRAEEAIMATDIGFWITESAQQRRRTEDCKPASSGGLIPLTGERLPQCGVRLQSIVRAGKSPENH